MSYYKDSYSVNEIFLDFLGRKYIVKVGGTTPSIPFDSDLKEDDTIIWGDLRLVEYHEGGGGTIEGLYSKDFNDVTAPQTVNIKVGTNFVQSPIEVLKEGAEQTNVQRNIETFDDGTDFNYNNNYVEFDGTAHLKTSYAVNMSTPQMITDGTTTGYISESDNIDFNNWDSVREVGIYYE